MINDFENAKITKVNCKDCIHQCVCFKDTDKTILCNRFEDKHRFVDLNEREIKTNFDKITSSVDALAEFIETISIKEISKERIVQWLKEPDDD